MTKVDESLTLASLHRAFQQEIERTATGRFLEIGSRARSGITRLHLVPGGWQYTGLDIIQGENVSVVGDAHQLSTFLEHDAFDAVAAFSVLEHLLMPWKVVIELNRVMKVGSVGLMTTHQAWPVHDAPWDFWRFSGDCWGALFNARTGFEIVASGVGEPGHVVAARCHGATHFGDAPDAYLASGVVFRKIADTTLAWDVTVGEIISTHYPETITTPPRESH